MQLTVMIPTPEPFELRQWFEEEASTLLGEMPYEVQERLRTVIDQEGGTQLRTPRSVVRTLDSLRFFWPAVKSENIDVADLVWLQLIKDGSPALYRWIQDYVASSSAISFGTASVTDSGKEKRLKALLEAADEGQLSDVLYRHMFSDILPGVEASYADDGPPVSIHEKVSHRDIQTAIEGRRLASPDHYRIYFSLIGPSHAITQAGFDRLWAALDTSPEEAATLILELHNQKAVGALRKSDVLFERLKSMDVSLWTPLRAQNLLIGLGQMMDAAYRRHPSEDSFIVSSWDRAERLVPMLYARITAADRSEVNRQLFAEGSALGWLTSIFRREIFAHGRYGSRTRPPEEWLLPEAEFQATATIMVERYRSMTIDEILETPRALHILFAWNQAGDSEGPKNLIAASTQDDEQLVRVLGAFVSSINSSDRGRYAVLKRENMESFMDFDVIVSRLGSIARNAEEPVKGRAAELIGYMDDGKKL